MTEPDSAGQFQDAVQAFHTAILLRMIFLREYHLASMPRDVDPGGDRVEEIREDATRQALALVTQSFDNAITELEDAAGS